MTILLLEQNISILKQNYIYQVITNWPPGDEWFVKFNYIRNDDTPPTSYQKLLWFKETSASNNNDDGMYIPMFESIPNTYSIKGYFSHNGGFHDLGSMVIPKNTKVQFSMEQRRSNTDGKLYVKFYKDGIMITSLEVTNHRVFQKVYIVIGNNDNEIKNRVSEFRFGKL